MNFTSLTGQVGESVQLIATVEPENASNKSVIWSSSDTSKAAVTSGGMVTSAAEGTVSITATTLDGDKTATCEITIQASEQALLGSTFILGESELG